MYLRKSRVASKQRHRQKIADFPFGKIGNHHHVEQIICPVRLRAEAKAAANALKKLGGQYEETRAFTLPDGSARGLVFCKKISQTPTVYPRNGGKIAKKPL